MIFTDRQDHRAAAPHENCDQTVEAVMGEYEALLEQKIEISQR